MSVALQQAARRGPEIEVEEIRSSAALAALGSAWDTLHAEAGLTHPFASHLWIRTFWESYGTSARLAILVVRRLGKIIGIAPLMRTTRTFLGMRFRTVETIRNPQSPRSEVILTKHASEAARMILEHLIRAGDFDMLELAHLPADSTALARLHRQAQRLGLRSGLVDLGGSPYLELPSDWESYLHTLGRRHRGNLKNKRGRLERIGEIALETVPAARARDIDDALRLESSDWKRDQGSAIVSDAATSHFYRVLATRAAERGWLYLHFLSVGGRRIAMHYSLLFERRIHVLKSGYDPEFRSYSPGTILHELAIAQAIRDGLVEFDFLGDPDPWKLAWTSTVRPHRWLYIFPNHLRGRLLHFAKLGALARLRRSRLAAAATAEEPE